MSRLSHIAILRTLPAVLLAGLAASPAAAAGLPELPNVDPRLGPIVREAVVRAATRLESAGCALVLEDFRDPRSGRTLAETVSALGQTGASYLASGIVYKSGSGLSRCENRCIFATASPGSRIVYVCKEQFVERYRKDEGLAVNILIHETLHSLGLGENPPDSKEITARVVARCGR